jgi:hypothetical protein
LRISTDWKPTIFPHSFHNGGSGQKAVPTRNRRCTKFLSRYNDPIAESWRFPVIDTYGGGADVVNDSAQFDDYNEVTFIYAGADSRLPTSVSVIGTFATLYEPIPLERVTFEGEPTRFWSLTYVVPRGQRHLYRFIVDGAFPVNDPVNPQLELQDNGQSWSRFFTVGCAERILA